MASKVSIGSPPGVGVCLEHQRRHRGHQHGLGDPGAAVAAEVAGVLPAAGGVPDQHRVVQVEGFDQVRQVIGLGVHVVAGQGLPGPAVAAAVVGDGAVAAGRPRSTLGRPARRRSAASRG